MQSWNGTTGVQHGLVNGPREINFATTPDPKAHSRLQSGRQTVLLGTVRFLACLYLLVTALYAALVAPFVVFLQYALCAVYVGLRCSRLSTRTDVGSDLHGLPVAVFHPQISLEPAC